MPERPHRNDRAHPRSTRGDLPTHAWPVSGDGHASGDGRSAANIGGDSRSGHSVSGDGRTSVRQSGDGRASAHYSGDGRSSFLPAHSGDGNGRKTSNPADLEVALWSGENYAYYGGPHASAVPVPSHGHATGSGRPTDYPRVGSMTGDGQGRINMEDLGKMEDVQLKVNVPKPNSASFPVDLKTKPTPASETWKLVCLVVIFLVWISTASTLLFLYMDRYLFP